jgi:hypothetical protein
MRNRQAATAFVLMLALAAALTAQAAFAQEGPRRALVIGNTAYAALPPLPGCTASAHLVAATLRRAGFDVTERLDRSNGQMGGDLAAVADAASRQPGAVVVAYVCGYAMGLDNRAFLLPVSAAIERETDVLTQGLVAKSVLDAVKRSGASAGLVLLDGIAKPASSGRLSFAALASASPAENVAVAATAMATAPPEGATPFANALSAAMAAPDVEAGALLKALQQRLAANTAIELTVAAPSGPAWLAGGPAAARASPSSTPSSPAPQPPALSGTAAGAFPDEARMSAEDRTRIQTALLHLGYYDGRVDGIFGAETRAAIRRFQHEIGADMTGQITPVQASRLLAGGR